MFEHTKPTRYREVEVTTPTTTRGFLITVRAGWYLGYPVAGEEPLQLVHAVPMSYGYWIFGKTRQLTTDERQRLEVADLMPGFWLAQGVTEAVIDTQWMLLMATPTNPGLGSMASILQRSSRAGSGVGV